MKRPTSQARHSLPTGFFATRTFRPITSWRCLLPRAVALGVALVGCVAGAAQATDIGFDPSNFRVVYTVNGGPVPGEPVYKVEVPGAAGLNFNTSQTPFLLPCEVNRFGVDVFAGSTPESDPVFWAVTVSFFQLKANQPEQQIVSHGCLGDTTFDSGTGDVTPVLMPGTSAEAGFTPIDSVDLPYCRFQFQPDDLKKNTPVRMQLQLQGYTDNTFATLVPDTNPSNNVISLWVKRAC
jgi:hypothetical protein